MLTGDATHEYNADGSVYRTHATRGDAGTVLADYGEGFAVVIWDHSGEACDAPVGELVAVGHMVCA